MTLDASHCTPDFRFLNDTELLRWKKEFLNDSWQKIIMPESLKVIYGGEELDFILFIIIH